MNWLQEPDLGIDFSNPFSIKPTATCGIISLNEHYTSLFDNPELWETDVKFLENMKRAGFIIPEDRDEYKVVRQVSKQVRRNTNEQTYTIAPTLVCNFRCPYCYEEGHRYNTMDARVIQQTIEHINRKKTPETSGIQIAWYGGEPLIRLDIIEQITNGIYSEDIPYTAGIVTNGYFLTSEAARKLQKLHVKHAQVTIDGPPDIHNKRRCLPDFSDTFFKILRNISEAVEFIPITIRVNLDNENRDRADEILNYLDEYNLRGKVTVYLAAVSNIHGSCSDTSCMIDREFSDFEYSFMKKHLDRGYSFVHLPSFNAGICGAVCESSCVIDPLGDLYKCWNEVGRKEMSYSTILSTESNSNLDKWNDYVFDSESECGNCVYLPTCMGGCPYENIVQNSRKCLSVKNNGEQMVRLLREMMIVNKAQVNIQ